MTMSKGEAIIYRLLKTSNIRFIQEKQFSDLRNGYMRFDFYLPDDEILVEYDGEQHFHFNKLFHKQKSDFTKAQERDRLKNSFSLAKGIKLYRIPYWEMNNIVSLSNLFQEKFLVKSKFHNDEIWREYKKHQKLKK